MREILFGFKLHAPGYTRRWDGPTVSGIGVKEPLQCVGAHFGKVCNDSELGARGEAKEPLFSSKFLGSYRSAVGHTS